MTLMRKRYVQIALAYFGFIIFFSVAYFATYTRNHDSFAFNTVIHQQKLGVAKHELENKIEKLQNARKLVSLALKSIEDSNASILDSSTLRAGDSTLHLRLVTWAHEGVSGVSYEGTEILVLGEKPLIIDEYHYRNLRSLDTVEQWRQHAMSLHNNLSGRIQFSLHGINSEGKENWGYLDFLYFSVVTQSTTGYGDILPNSGIVRILVVTQIAVGILFFLVLLNLIKE